MAAAVTRLGAAAATGAVVGAVKGGGGAMEAEEVDVLVEGIDVEDEAAGKEALAIRGAPGGFAKGGSGSWSIVALTR